MKILLLLSFLAIVACSQSQTDQTPVTATRTIRYAAIGDSYTIGEGAAPEAAFPNVLTEKLRKNGIDIRLVANPSRTGWTSQQAIELELPVYDASNPDFATLLIGVNDWVQGVDEISFRRNLITLIEKMQVRLKNKNHLILITIPDFSVTPQGRLYGRGRDISAGIAGFNRIILEEARLRNLRSVDIFEVSKQMGTDRSLVADDGLHPSARMYAMWADLIYPVAVDLIKK